MGDRPEGDWQGRKEGKLRGIGIEHGVCGEIGKDD